MNVKKKYTLNERKEIIEEFGKSNLTQKAWCEKKKIGLSTFKNWKREFDNEDKVSSEKSEKVDDNLMNNDSHWISVVPEEINNFEGSHIKLTIGKINIETTPNFNEQHLEKIIRVISRV